MLRRRAVASGIALASLAPIHLCLAARTVDHVQETSYLTAEWVVAYASIALAIATTALWIATHKLHKGAERASRTTAEQMKDQITAAVASHQAMAEVAEATRNNAQMMSTLWRKQFRAYMVVEFGIPTYQDENMNFAASVVMRNAGITPAYNVSYWIKARIFKTGAVDTAKPAGTMIVKTDTTMAPSQNLNIRDTVEHRFSDQEVEAILTGSNQWLFAFGEVTYEDIHGASHVTKFCHYFQFFRHIKTKELQQIPVLYSEHNSAS